MFNAHAFALVVVSDLDYWTGRAAIGVVLLIRCKCTNYSIVGNRERVTAPVPVSILWQLGELGKSMGDKRVSFNLR